MSEDQAQKTPLSASILLRLAGMGFLSGAVLGQLIDFAYPLSNTLHYHHPIWKSGGFEVCWWIPGLYGVAGMILWVGYPLWDRKLGHWRASLGSASVAASHVNCLVRCHASPPSWSLNSYTMMSFGPAYSW